MGDKQPKTENAALRAILENAVDAIITIDEHGVIESLNPATSRLFQYEPKELLGRNVNLLMPEPFHAEHDGYIRRYLATGEAKIIGIGREVVGRRKDGSTFPMHLAVSVFVIDGLRKFTGIVRDITDIKAAEDELAQLNEELEERVVQRTAELAAAQAELVAKEKLAVLGQLSGGIAHEIRNPLNAIKTSAYYLLNARNASEEKQREHLERIDRQVTMIDNVVTALADVARLPEPKIDRVDCLEAVEAVLEELKLPAEVDVAINVPSGFPRLQVDGQQIRIVFRNLLENARDAMPNGGTIQFTAQRCGVQQACVSVVDSGIGIPAEELARILEPLYSTKTRGIGLGLAICQAILKKNLGVLEVESEVGAGSTFRVLLPTTQ